MKKFVAMLLALVMVFALCACGSNGDKAAADNNGDYHLVLKLSHVFAPTEQLTIEMQQVAQRIAEILIGVLFKIPQQTGIQLFGGQAVPLFALACAVSYMLSGYSSLYHSQLLTEKDLKFGSMITPEKDCLHG